MDLLPRTSKKEKKTGVPVFVIFSFLINTDTALSSGLFKTGGRIRVNNPELVWVAN